MSAKQPLGTFAMISRVAYLIAYIALSITSLVYLGTGDTCFVRHTFKQEFLSNIVANPYFSSAGITPKVPMSPLESGYHTVSARTSDIYTFPVVIENYVDSAFVQKDSFDPIFVFDATMPMTPNILRCMNQGNLLTMNDPAATTLAKLAAKTAALDDFNDIMDHYHARGYCILTGQQQMSDVSSDYKASIDILSSLNVLFMASMISAISASWAWFQIKVPDSWFENKDLVDDIVFGSCMAWNFIITGTIISLYGLRNLPANNIVIGVIAMLATVAMQYRKANAGEEEDEEEIPTGVPTGREGDDGAHQFVKYSGKNWVHQPLLVIESRFTSPHYIDTIRERGDFDQLRCIEYAITTPLIVVTVMCCCASNIPTCILQIAFAATLYFHFIGIALMDVSRSCKQADDAHKHKLQVATLAMAFVCILMLGIAMYCFSWTRLSVFSTSYSSTLDLQMAFVCVLIFEPAFALVFTSHYIWDSRTDPNAQMNIMLRKTETVFYSIFHFMLTVAVVSMLIHATTLKAFPGGACSVWLPQA